LFGTRGDIFRNKSTTLTDHGDRIFDTFRRKTRKKVHQLQAQTTPAPRLPQNALQR